MLLSLVVNGTKIAADLHDFPVFVEITHPALRNQSTIHFTTDGGASLPAEITLDHASGALSAWVRVPHLPAGVRTMLLVEPGEGPAGAWDGYALVLHEPAVGSEAQIQPLYALTVEAWVETDDARAEAMQALVSTWRVGEDFAGADAYDASCTERLDTTGFFGAVFDGRYVYFSPAARYREAPRQGAALRYPRRFS